MTSMVSWQNGASFPHKQKVEGEIMGTSWNLVLRCTLVLPVYTLMHNDMCQVILSSGFFYPCEVLIHFCKIGGLSSIIQLGLFSDKLSLSIMGHAEHWQSSVLDLEDSALDVDQVENLIKFCPTKEEMELLKVWKTIMLKLEYHVLFIFSLLRIFHSLLRSHVPQDDTFTVSFQVLIAFIILCSELHWRKGKVREMWTGV